MLRRRKGRFSFFVTSESKGLLAMKRRRYTKRIFLYGAGAYMILWILTAMVGLPSLNREFDKEFAQGYVGLGPGTKPHQVERIPFVPMRNPDSFPPNLPTLFRCRSRGIPIAPFIIIDEASWQTNPLWGYSGKRVVFWLFCKSWWFPLRTYWVS